MTNKEVDNTFFKICFLYLKNWSVPLKTSYVTEDCGISMDILNELEFRKWIKFTEDSIEITDLGKITGVFTMASLEFGGNIWETTVYNKWVKMIDKEESEADEWTVRVN